MNRRHSWLVARGSWLLCVLISSLCFADPPEITQTFPPETVLLGQPVDWTIEVRHDLWQAYVLTINPVDGVQAKLVDQSISQSRGGVLTVFRLRLAARSLVIPGVPSVTLIDQNGESVTVTGRPVRVKRISGESMEIRDPQVPRFPPAPRFRHPWLLAGLVVLAAVAALIAWLLRRRSARSPARRLLRQLKSALAMATDPEFQKSATLWKLLHSEQIWGASTAACTAVELTERSAGDARLNRIAATVQVLELARYSGNGPAVAPPAIKDSLEAAIGIMDEKINRRERGERRVEIK